MKSLRASFLFVVALNCVPVSAEAVPGSTDERIGRAGANRTVLPFNQVVTPLGVQIDLPGLRPQVLVRDPVSGEVRQRVALPDEKVNEPRPEVVSPNILTPDKDGQVSFTGLIFSTDGRRTFLSNVHGSIKVFTVAADGTVAR